MRLVLSILLGIFWNITFAQDVHIHKINPKLQFEKQKGIKIHGTPESLLKRQRDFQNIVFTKANVQPKTSKLNFEEKEDLLEALEEYKFEKFTLKFPQFTKAEYLSMKEAIYE